MDKKFLGLSILLIITFILFAGVVFLNGRLNIFTRASVNTQPSLSNSLIFAWPLEIPADGSTKSEITIFVRNTEGRGVANQQVRLNSSMGLIQQPVSTTNTEGKAVFALSSNQSGVAQIEALVNNSKLQRSISVKFR